MGYHQKDLTLIKLFRYNIVYYFEKGSVNPFHLLMEEIR
jgi:hypothetical protein